MFGSCHSLSDVELTNQLVSASLQLVMVTSAQRTPWSKSGVSEELLYGCLGRQNEMTDNTWN